MANKAFAAERKKLRPLKSNVRIKIKNSDMAMLSACFALNEIPLNSKTLTNQVD